MRKLKTKKNPNYNPGYMCREFFLSGKKVGFYTYGYGTFGIRGFGIDTSTVVVLTKKDFFNNGWGKIHNFLKEQMGESYDFEIVKELISWMIKDMGYKECPICGMPVDEGEFRKYKAHWGCKREKADLLSPLFP